MMTMMMMMMTGWIEETGGVEEGWDMGMMMMMMKMATGPMSNQTPGMQQKALFKSRLKLFYGDNSFNSN